MRIHPEPAVPVPLNESPSEKEGKLCRRNCRRALRISLNESPSEKEGKWGADDDDRYFNRSLNESPSEKEGKCALYAVCTHWVAPSMKVPPKRKGNPVAGCFCVY